MKKRKAVIGYLWRIKDGLVVAQRRWRYRKHPSSKHFAEKEGFEEVEVYEPGEGEAEGEPVAHEVWYRAGGKWKRWGVKRLNGVQQSDAGTLKVSGVVYWGENLRLVALGYLDPGEVERMEAANG